MASGEQTWPDEPRHPGRWLPVTAAVVFVLLGSAAWLYWWYVTAYVSYTAAGTDLVSMEIRLNLHGVAGRDLRFDPFVPYGREPVPMRLQLMPRDDAERTWVRLSTLEDSAWEFEPAVYLTHIPHALRGVQLWRATSRLDSRGERTYIISPVHGEDDDPNACTVVNLIPRRCNRSGREAGACFLQRTQFALCDGGEVFVDEGSNWALIPGTREQ